MPRVRAARRTPCIKTEHKQTKLFKMSDLFVYCKDQMPREQSEDEHEGSMEEEPEAKPEPRRPRKRRCIRLPSQTAAANAGQECLH